MAMIPHMAARVPAHPRADPRGGRVGPFGPCPGPGPL